MLSPWCKPGDKESDLLISTLFDSDGDEAAEVGGSRSLAQAGKGDIVPFVPSPGKDYVCSGALHYGIRMLGGADHPDKE